MGYWTASSGVVISLAAGDSYFFNPGDGRDQVIESIADTGKEDWVRFGKIDKTDLWFSQVGDHLLISIVDTDDSVQINNWFSEGAAVERITVGSDPRLSLLAADVPKLVTAMAIVTPPIDGVLVVTDSELQQVLEVIEANWHQ